MDLSPCRLITLFLAGGREWLTTTRCYLRAIARPSPAHLHVWQIRISGKSIRSSGWCSCSILIHLWGKGLRKQILGKPFNPLDPTHFSSVKPVISAIPDRKSTRLNSSHLVISYAVFCLKKKKRKRKR